MILQQGVTSISEVVYIKMPFFDSPTAIASTADTLPRPCIRT
ncbi:hypothetical protein COO91_10376 (plasmid) [Nostoc flagelliforme CCNUN1]|uniref:Uncharacterized protein n=1 Tax=Nostoc flagelliforme CCNUN1 TaxID=2038116 RepID=A0A2K8T8Y1_9NOSO|nr:hypothetical protein [Nostoc flagelliforme]AUB44156.1 hypothetical protein COO91_10376 [Nostoc flagelliforme CCNUN1]